ncbi:MAG TPA: lamin tail domain-containing protein [Actinomycetales bacterium]|nr:lamin tail domain-containing protein [Actinomycetales bacterium]
MPALRTTIGTAVAGCAVVVAGLTAAPTAQAVDTSSSVIINEVYGGGGNSGAPYTNDFIELVNTGSSPVDLSDWSVQYASASGTSWQVTKLSGSVAAGARYLVGEAKGSGTTMDPLPTPDVSGSIAMSGSSGKVALVNHVTALSGCADACSDAAGVVDFVGYGGANDAAGDPTPALSNTTSAQRKNNPVVNTGDNSSDFTVLAPTPGAVNTTAPGGPDCSATPLPDACVPGSTTIQDVQGDGFVSPLDGQTVEKVPGVVTALRSSGSRGFWVQEVSPDTSRPSASSGVFVYSSSATVRVGDSVLVSGKVTDYYAGGNGRTDPSVSSLSVTEITPTTITVVSADNPLPATLALTPTTVPDTYAPTVASGNVEDIAAVDPTSSALEFWEAHEGMLVSVDDARVVGPGKPQYGEIYVTTKPDQQPTYRGGTYLDSYDMPSGRLLVSPTNGIVPAANVGDVLMGTTSGPVDWSTYGGYDIAATTLGQWQAGGLTPNAAAPQAPDQLAIATYNVENLAPGDPDSKYQRLAAGVVTNLASPDVVTLEEIQDNSGATDDGTVAADQTLTKLTAAITAAGGPSYQWAEIDPVNDEDGGQPGGNIRVAFLYNPDRVTFVQRPGGDSTTAVGVTEDSDGTASLTASPGRIDPTNPAWEDSRKPLAGEFVFAGTKVFVVANHFNSKGGDQSADGRYQPPTRSSEVQRVQQATVVNTFVKQLLAVDPDANVVLAGDFNDYQFSPAMKTLTDDGATLTDLITTLPADQQYTYNFNGISQVLDHIFVSKVLSAPGAVEYEVIHLNSEFSDQVSDHDPQVVRIRPVAHATPSPTGTVQAAPWKVKPGGHLQVIVRGFDADAELNVFLDGTTALGSLTTNKHGMAVGKVDIPRSTSSGEHSIVVRTADGSYAETTIMVR